MNFKDPQKSHWLDPYCRAGFQSSQQRIITIIQGIKIRCYNIKQSYGILKLHKSDRSYFFANVFFDNEITISYKKKAPAERNAYS
jgi:hypothetical protein